MQPLEQQGNKKAPPELTHEALEIEYQRLLSLLSEDEFEDFLDWNNTPTKTRVRWLQSYLGER